MAQSENVSLGDFIAETKSEQPETTMEDPLAKEKSENTSTEPETSSTEQKNEDNSDASQAETAKRPKGPFLRFALANRDKYQALHPKLMHHQLFRLMGKDWKKLSEDEKKPYNDQFHEELLEYKKLNPDNHYATSQEGSHLQGASIRRHRLRPEPPKLLPFEPVETPRKKRRNRCDDPRPSPSNKARVMCDDSESYEKYAESWQHANQGNAFKTTAFMDIFRKADAATRKSIIKEMAWGIFEHF